MEEKKSKAFDSFLTKTQIAHRGLHDKDLPENGIGSFRAAIQKGYAIELDIQLSKDGVPMVFHDASLKRMTGKEGNVSDYTAAELQSFKLLNSSETIPTLEQVKGEVAGKVPLLIETKNMNPTNTKQEKATMQTMKDYGGEFAFQSFNPYSVHFMKKHSKEILQKDVMVGQLSGSMEIPGLNPAAKMAVKGALKLPLGFMMFNPLTKPDFVSYEWKGLRDGWFDKDVVEYSTNDKPLVCWGINSPEDYKQAKASGIRIENIVFEQFCPKTEKEKPNQEKDNLS